MAIGIVKNETSLFIKEEVTEGTAVAPTLASDAIEITNDFAGFSYAAEQINRNNLTSTIEKVASRIGMAKVDGETGVELKANHVAGNAPYADILYKSLLGNKNHVSSVALTAGATTTVLNMADTTGFVKGMAVKVNAPGAHEIRPVIGVAPTALTLGIALTSAPAAGVMVEAVTTYNHVKGAPTFTATAYTGGKIKNVARGLRAVSMSVDGWETSKLVTTKFKCEGLDLAKSAEVPTLAPNFSGNALPPVVLSACAWVNGVKVPYSSFNLSVENTKSEMLSACSPNGKIGSRFTALSVKGELNPYMDDSNVDRFDAFKNNSDVSIFIFAANPTGVAGEIKECIAYYIPQAKVTALKEENLDGIMVDKLSFESYRLEGGDSLYVSFI